MDVGDNSPGQVNSVVDDGARGGNVSSEEVLVQLNFSLEMNLTLVCHL